MASASLIPDRQLTFSPDLAQTIGLEEAILLQGIGQRLNLAGDWQTLQLGTLAQDFPFWSEDRIRDLLQRLADLGILSLLPAEQADWLRVAPAGSSGASMNPMPSQTPRTTSAPAPAAMAAAWQPPSALLDLLELNHGITRSFALTQLDSFDPGDASSRDARFRQTVLSAHRRAQSEHPVFKVPEPTRFDGDWQPSADARDILNQGGVDPDFADSVRAEFILYWRERGGPPRDVNSRFVAFVRQRWARHQSGLTHTREPQRLSRDWQPDPSVWDMLDMAGVDRGFTQERLPEFVLYWVDSNELHTSWNSKFLQHIKHQWRRHQSGGASNDQQQIGGGAGAGGRTRDRSIAEDLSDTSWAQ